MSLLGSDSGKGALMSVWRGKVVSMAIVFLAVAATGPAVAAEAGLASQGVRSKGVRSLQEGAALDLDRGRLTLRRAADIWHTRDEQGRLVLMPSENVMIGLLGEYRPSERDCLSAQYLPTPVRMHRLRPARYFCVLTNRGRFAALRVLATPGGDGALKLEHRTFARVYAKTPTSGAQQR